MPVVSHVWFTLDSDIVHSNSSLENYSPSYSFLLISFGGTEVQKGVGNGAERRNRRVLFEIEKKYETQTPRKKR